MKVTQLRIESPRILAGVGPGTGKYQGNEIYPTTKTSLTKLGLSLTPTAAQDIILDKLPDEESFNNLREYQKEDVLFLAARKNAACFNEQRTGKTPIALSTMKAKGVDKLLIIAPASTLYTWAKECKTWWFNNLPVYICDGTAQKRKKIIKDWKIGAFFLSYE